MFIHPEGYQFLPDDEVIGTQGLSVFFPPFAVLFMGKGRVLFTVRFEKTFNGVFEKLLNHIITK